MSRKVAATHNHENKEKNPKEKSDFIKRSHKPSINDISNSLTVKHHPLQDITNLHNIRPIENSTRPVEGEISTIIQPNHILSNFVVSHFFIILAQSFKNILYTEFLFDLVKRDGSWKQFFANSNTEGHYVTLFNGLQEKQSICIIPIRYQLHWTILIRKFIDNAWQIFFIDSLVHGSDQRFSHGKLYFKMTIFSLAPGIRSK